MTSGRTAIPILLYHSISSDPAPWIRRFTVTPEAFSAHLDVLTAVGATTMTVSAYVEALARGPSALPERPVLVTFDDGFADFHDAALPALRLRDLTATLYATTGFVGTSGPRGRMLDWDQLRAVAAEVEVGGHTHTHPQLDAVGDARARDEVTRCKALLEDALQREVPSFAFPHGYSSAPVRAMVRDAGYRSACAVKNAFSCVDDDPFALARLTVRSDTSLREIASWVAGIGAPVADARDSARTRAWRVVRRTRAAVGRRRTPIPARPAVSRGSGSLA